MQILRRVFLVVFITFLTSFLPVSLSADIIYKGVCGSYQYDLNISSNKFYGAFCSSGSLQVYWQKSGTDQILTLYTDPTYNSFDLYDYKHNVKKSFDYDDGQIVNIGSPYTYFLFGLAGLLIGLSFLYVVMRLV
jgi:hypothetical protein